MQAQGVRACMPSGEDVPPSRREYGYILNSCAWELAILRRAVVWERSLDRRLYCKEHAGRVIEQLYAWSQVRLLWLRSTSSLSLQICSVSLCASNFISFQSLQTLSLHLNCLKDFDQISCQFFSPLKPLFFYWHVHSIDFVLSRAFTPLHFHVSFTVLLSVVSSEVFVHMRFVTSTLIFFGMVSAASWMASFTPEVGHFNVWNSL